MVYGWDFDIVHVYYFCDGLLAVGQHDQTAMKQKSLLRNIIAIVSLTSQEKAELLSQSRSAVPHNEG